MRAFNAVVTTVACYYSMKKSCFMCAELARRGAAARMSDLLLRVWIFNSGRFCHFKSTCACQQVHCCRLNRSCAATAAAVVGLLVRVRTKYIVEDLYYIDIDYKGTTKHCLYDYTVENIRQGAKLFLRNSIYLYEKNSKIDAKLNLDIY